jgi:hypothetical protein
MQSFATSHKKKASNFSSIAPQKVNQSQSYLKRSRINQESIKDSDAYHQILLRS